MGKPEGKRPCGTLRHTWEDNIEMYLQEVEWRGEWITLIWLGTGTGGGLL
jgi:hypothetical protein